MKVIKSVVQAAKYSGYDVWLVPAFWHNNELEPLHNHWREIIKYKMSNGDIRKKGWDRTNRPYIGDDWVIQNANIYGYDDEICFIVRDKNV